MIEIYALASLCAAIPVVVIVHCGMRRRLLSLLSVYSILFIGEYSGGAIKCLYLPDEFPDITRQQLTNTLAVGLAGYVVFLLGYLFLALSPLTRESMVSRRVIEGTAVYSNTRYKRLVLFSLLIAIVVGFLPQYQKIMAVGGLTEYMHTAYQHRFGTMAETDKQNALIVLATFVGNSAVALAGVGVYLWRRRCLSRAEALLLSVLIVLLLFRQWATTLRANVIFALVALIATASIGRRITMRRGFVVGGAIVAVLLTVNVVHQYMYEVTAGWERKGIGSSLIGLVAPHGHVDTLSRILATQAGGAEPLKGKGLIESVFFFVPRFMWPSKAPSGEYGTLIVQDWASLPNWYQIAITNIGELIAHFGWIGILGLTVYGMIYAAADAHAQNIFSWRIGAYCLLLPRVMADIGMGISALAVTVVSFALYLLWMRVLRIFGGGEPVATISPVRLIPMARSGAMTSRPNKHLI